MPWLDTAKVDRRTRDIEHQLQVYNGLDCCITYEVFEALRAKIEASKSAKRVYQFELGMCAPAMEMSLRGWRVNMFLRSKFIDEFERDLLRLEEQINEFAFAVWGKPFNPNSTKQFAEFFYGALGIDPIYKSEKGEKKLDCSRTALEQLEVYLYARPFVLHALKIKELKKKLSVLRSGVDSDKRIRCSYNPAATVTGRWSSSENILGTGTNLQNIEDKLREMFIADPGWKLAVPDLEQAESRIVGAIIRRLFNDTKYLDACEGGDLHTAVTMLVWTTYSWYFPGGNVDQQTADRLNREIADTIFYRHFSHRDMAKRGGHGTNYKGTAWTMSKHLKVAKDMVEEFQRKYFAAFPGIQKWHRHVAQQIMVHQELTTVLGRERQFFGRRDDETTIRSAIAHEPQSICGDTLNVGMWQLWKEAIEGKLEIQLLGQIHDAVAFQYPDDREKEGIILNRAKELLTVPIDFGDFHLVIPCEMKVGWNWRPQRVNKDKTIENPDGLIKWKGKDERRRQFDPEDIRLDQIIS